MKFDNILDYNPQELGDCPQLCNKLADAHDRLDKLRGEQPIRSGKYSNQEDVDKAQKFIIDLINQGDNEFTSEQLAAQYAYSEVVNQPVTSTSLPKYLEEQLDWLEEEGAVFDRYSALNHSILIFCHYL
ncbi:MAG: hypothetical protein AB2784_21875 [Candidatus Thiodiazotropha endolucinida]